MCRMQTFTKLYFTFSVKPSLSQRVVRAHELRVEDKTTFICTFAHFCTR